MVALLPRDLDLRGGFRTSPISAPELSALARKVRKACRRGSHRELGLRGLVGRWPKSPGEGATY